AHALIVMQSRAVPVAARPIAIRILLPWLCRRRLDFLANLLPHFARTRRVLFQQFFAASSASHCDEVLVCDARTDRAPCFPDRSRNCARRSRGDARAVRHLLQMSAG